MKKKKKNRFRVAISTGINEMKFLLWNMADSLRSHVQSYRFEAIRKTT